MNPEDLSFRHLLAELMRIDVTIRRQVKRWQGAGQDPGDDFRGLYVSEAQARALLEQAFGTNWGTGVELEAETAGTLAALEARALGEIDSCRKRAHEAGLELRLDRLRRVFRLEAFDFDSLLICLCPALDLRYERLYGYLQDDVTRKRPGVNLILDLLCPSGPERLTRLANFSATAPLRQHGLLTLIDDMRNGPTPLLSHSLELDETILHWLLGNEYQTQPALALHLRCTYPQHDLTDELLTGEAWPAIAQSSPDDYRLVFYGPDQTARQAGARLLAARRNSALLSLDLGAILELQEAPELALLAAARDARLMDAVLYVEGWDRLAAGESPPPELLKLILQAGNAVVLAGHNRWLPGEVEEPAGLRWYEFPRPRYARRLALWRHYLQACMAPAVQVENLDLEVLAGQFILTGGQIRDAAASAGDHAGQIETRLTADHLFAAARAHSNPRLSSLARKIEPRYGWTDIVLPPDQRSIMEELIATVRQRSRVLEDWGLGRKLVSSQGVTVLFAGQPGTGKTMAAEVIAGVLGLDLYRIDLSTVVSKYIGETEKNLERIFSEAANSNAILFFDEADALFGKRSEVRDSHDRYANIEISYLLQRMEAYEGVTILATNLRANLDEAFTRRLQFAVDFPFPDEAQRLLIWRTLFPPQVPRAPDLDLEQMAARFKLAGGSIRNILVSAAYLAASDGEQVTMEHLLHGARRELQKMGRLLPEYDLVKGVI